MKRRQVRLINAAIAFAEAKLSVASNDPLEVELLAAVDAYTEQVVQGDNQNGNTIPE